MMRSPQYIEVLRKKVVPELEKMHPDGFGIMQQDLVPCHTLKVVKKFMTEQQIQVVDWPGNSLDINPTANLWTIRKRRLRSMDCTTMEKLVQALIQVCYRYPKINSDYSKLVDSMPNRFQMLLKNRGALSFSMRSVSPLIGFILCSVCLSIYVNPLENTHLSPGDSQWIGAWWLGYIIIGTIAIIGGFFVGQFPKILPSHHQTPAMKMAIIVANNKENIPKEMNLFTKIYSSVKGLFPALRRLFTNILYLLRFSSGIISWFGMDGLVIFLPKYLENQFYLTQSEASLATGTAKVISLIVGFPCVGYIVHRLRPTCRQFTMALIVSKLIYSAFLLVLMGLFCTNSYVIGMNLSNNIPTCDVNCECSALPFTPVCGSDDRNYLSACYAGCSVVNSSISIQNPRIYENCSCISGGFTSDNFCGKNCSLYYVYVVILFIGNFLLSLNGLGEMILLLRSVSVEDKTVGLGVFHSTFSLLICLPAPLIFSALVDGACTLWSLSCRETGNCLLYDLDQLRYLLHAIPAALLIIGTIIDFLFWLKAKDVTLFGEEDDIKTDAYSEDS